MKLSFKKEPRERGLAAVGAGEPTTNIKADKKQVGYISFPNWRSDDRLIRIRLMVKNPEDPTDWYWITLKEYPKDEAEARQWLKDNWTKIISKYDLRQSGY